MTELCFCATVKVGLHSAFALPERLMILNVVRKNVEPGIAVLQMTGRMAMGSDSQKIEWGLAELLKENHHNVIFDLTEVTFLDSSGLGILMMCHAKLKKAG